MATAEANYKKDEAHLSQASGPPHQQKLFPQIHNGKRGIHLQPQKATT